MTGLEAAAVIAGAIWLLVVSLGVLVCIRQVGILLVTLSAGPRPAAAGDGLNVAMRVPGTVRALVPGIDELTYLLFVDSGCGACRDLVADLRGSPIDRRIVAVLRGSGRGAQGLRTLLPSGVEVIGDPEATEIAEDLKVEITPMVLEVELGVVTGKGVLRGIDDLKALVDARANSDAADIARNVARFNGLKVEVYDG